MSRRPKRPKVLTMTLLEWLLGTIDAAGKAVICWMVGGALVFGLAVVFFPDRRNK